MRRTSRPAGSARPSRTDCPAHACLDPGEPEVLEVHNIIKR
jgi:hypothetical protein